MEINYDDERFDLTKQAWVNHVPKTDDEMWLQAMCNDIWAKWQSDERVLTKMVRQLRHERMELQAKIDWLQIDNEELKKSAKDKTELENEIYFLEKKNEGLCEQIKKQNDSIENRVKERRDILEKIADALHQIHEGKTGNAIQILNHLAIL